jgi:DNA-binding LacI/PurR family transcriptional regulator/signal transduction histidine kinase/ActR/RegA family two-component response regulator
MARRPVIALLLNNAGLRDDYQGALRRGVERACIRRDFDLWVYAVRTDFKASQGAQLRIFDFMQAERVDGIVVAVGCIATANAVDALIERLRRICPVPLCSIGQGVEGAYSFVVDNRGGGLALADHLIAEHSRRRFAFIGGPEGHEESEARLAGVRDALSRHGLTLPKNAVAHGNYMFRSGVAATHALLDHGGGFDALVAANDDMARGALEALRAQGLGCPGDVSVVGFDDARNARIAEPPLSTVRQPVARLGGLAVAHIARAMKGGSPPADMVLATTLVLRESCGCSTSAPGRPAREMVEGVPREQSPIDIVARRLAPAIDDQRERRRWAQRLWSAFETERAGSTGALSRSLALLLSALDDPFTPTRELGRALMTMRELASEVPLSPRAEDAFHHAAALLASEAARRDADRDRRRETTLEELRLSGEQLATTLTQAALSAALHTRLPRFGIANAVVARYEQDDPEHLVPLVVLRAGVPVDPPPSGYEAKLLLPRELVESPERRSLTILALTFELQQLGIAVLDLPAGSEESTLLREQIGSAIQAVRMHQDSLQQERLRALAQEEKRATAERLRSLHLIAGGVAHDLNNALGPLLMLPETIRHELEDSGPSAVPADVLEDLSAIRKAGQRAAATIRDLMTLSQPTTGTVATLDLNKFLREESEGLRALCKGEAELVLDVAWHDRPLLIRASRPHLERALANLVINAIDATDGRGSIAIRAFDVVLRERLEGIEGVEPGSYAVIEVEDTGCGIPKELLGRVLEPFYTSRKRAGSKGTGLGLAIVQRIVKEASGYLRVESDLGRGATFGLYFPALVARPGCASERPSAVVGGSARVLVIDDEAVQLRAARRALARLGYDVVTASSGEAGLAAFVAARWERGFDLVVMDVLMPEGMDGMATAEKIRAMKPEQAFVMVSGWVPEMIAAAKTGRAIWLPKPYSHGELAAAVQRALRSPSVPPSQRAAG